MENPTKVSFVSVILQLSLFALLSDLFYNALTSLDNAFPNLSKDSSVKISLKSSAFASLPLFLMIIINTFLANIFLDSNKYVKTTRQVLSNTTENTFLCVINLLGAGVLNSLTNEQIVFIALCFVAARVFFYVGSIVGCLFNTVQLKTPGQALTLLVNFSVFGANLIRFQRFL